MKKIIIAMSVLMVLLAFVFVGCGEKEDGEVSTTSTTSTTARTTSTTTTQPSSASSSTNVSDKENIEDKITSALTRMSEAME